MQTVISMRLGADIGEISLTQLVCDVALEVGAHIAVRSRLPSGKRLVVELSDSDLAKLKPKLEPHCWFVPRTVGRCDL